MKIRLTAEHIRRGKRGLCTVCPVALAIAEALPGSDPWVYRHEITLCRHGRRVTVPAPDAVTAFVTAFDEGRGAGPFEFELPLPLAA